jgi:DNA-binding LacI/PurR family transcriptional regulator/signal transduction histidine kinase
METGKKATIGVILGEIGELFQSHVWPGIVEAANERGVGIVFFSGRTPATPVESDREIGIVYGLPDPARVDGLVIFASVLCNFLDDAENEAFFSRYSSIPCVTIAREIGDTPTILIENRSGMAALVEHFIKDHGKRRIAFIRGPSRSVEAEDRFAAYRDALDAHGIPYDESLVVLGTFLVESGAEAARILLDERKAHFDAIVAANDGMLIGALSVFRERGISVPEDVIAGGFDDIDEARAFRPPLTTVAQPLHMLGKVSLEVIADILAGKAIERITRVPVRFAPRASCGCTLEDKNAGRSLMRAATGEEAENSRLFEFLPVLSRATPGSDQRVGTQIVEALERILDEEIAGGCRGDQFMDIFADLLGSGLFETAGVPSARETLDALQSRGSSAGPERGILVASRMRDARILVAEHEGRLSGWRQLANQLSIIQRFSKSLSTALSTAEIHSVLEDNLKNASVNECYIALSDIEFPEASPIASPPARSRLVFAYRDGRRIAIPEGGIDFDTKLLVPDAVPVDWESGKHIVFPLAFKARSMGHIVFDLPLATGSVFTIEYLHNQISGALKALTTLDDLKAARERLLQTERMASLGELTAGIAHELKNPLNFVNNFAEGIEGLLAEIESVLDERKTADPGIRDALDPRLRDVREAARSIATHGKRANGIIRSMLNQARNDAKRMETVQVNSLVRESVGMASHAARLQYPTLAVRVEERLADGLAPIRGNPGELVRVITNILSNAYYSIHEKRQALQSFDGRIELSTRADGNGISIEIRDNGMGMGEAVKGQLFRPFFTTKPPNEGTGLGLKISREIVVDWHKGRIAVDSKEGDFAAFTVWLPLDREST